jgi:regulator of protease activity HflC (stomatin/prohibitin superfamily)
MSTGAYICGISLCVGVVALVVLMITSFSMLEVNEVGLDYSGITKTIDKNIKTAGIHFLGVAHSFIKFPITVQTYEFSNQGGDAPNIRSRTKDGLEVSLEVSFQYVYISNHLYDLYMKYGTDYRTPCLKIAIDVLTDTSTNYTASRFFFDKEVISQEMMQELNSTFAE